MMSIVNSSIVCVNCLFMIFIFNLKSQLGRGSCESSMDFYNRKHRNDTHIFYRTAELHC